MKALMPLTCFDLYVFRHILKSKGKYMQLVELKYFLVIIFSFLVNKFICK